MRLLLVSTPVGALGTGLGGGVELTLKNIAQALHCRGHRITVLAPAGSVLEGLSDILIVPIAGTLQSTAQSQGRDAGITMPGDAVLAAMWNYARQHQSEYDLIVNFAYDWLPFYLTPFFPCPIAHLVSMGSLSEAMDQVIGQVAQDYPGTIAVHSHTQADTFPFAAQCHCLGNGFDLSLYEFCPHPQPYVAWVGRIAPEKALGDALEAARQAQLPLMIMGSISDAAYWEAICQAYPEAIAAYQGFLPTRQLQHHLRQAEALLVTPRWVEAFGNVVVESLACGVPVIAYQRGGPAELVQHGKTGWLVEPDSIAGLVDSLEKRHGIDRAACRLYAEQTCSLEAMGDRTEQWLYTIVRSYQKPLIPIP